MSTSLSCHVWLVCTAASGNTTRGVSLRAAAATRSGSSNTRATSAPAKVICLLSLELMNHTVVKFTGVSVFLVFFILSCSGLTKIKVQGN